MLATLLTCVGTIANELFNSDYSITKHCQFFAQREIFTHPFVFLKTRENQESPLYWEVKDRKKTLDDLELQLIQHVFITTEDIPALQNLALTAIDPILPQLPSIHLEKCFTEKQHEKKLKSTWRREFESDTDADEETPAKRPTTMLQMVNHILSCFESSLELF